MSTTPASPAEPVTPERQAAAEHDHEHVERRAELLPEEREVGSDDPERQAQVILEDSEARTEVPNAAPATHLERRSSEDTV